MQNKCNYLFFKKIKSLKTTFYIIYGLKLFLNLQPVADASQFASAHSSIEIPKYQNR